MQETSTRSPGSSVVTAAPVSTTVPTASWPSTVPGCTAGTSPLRMCRSVPQIVAESIRTIASVGWWIAGSGTSSQERLPGRGSTSAFMAPPFGSPSASRAPRRAASAPAPSKASAFPQYAEPVDPATPSEPRLRALLEAGMALASELSLDGLVARLTQLAAEPTGPPYAALGVIDPPGSRLERFITHGIDGETRTA